MGRAKPWRELSRETLLRCRVFDVERTTAASPDDGSSHDFFRIRSTDWVQIVPVTGADEIVMVRQFRHGSSKLELEIPGGLVDPGEDPAAAAIRECLEETGYRADSVESMGSLNPNPAYHPQRLHAFCARDVHRVGDVQNTATEHTEVVLVPAADIPDLIRSNGIDHALVAVTLWRYWHDFGNGS